MHATSKISLLPLLSFRPWL